MTPGEARAEQAPGPALRVLYVVDSLAAGGAEISLTALVPRLAGVHPHVCHLYPGDRLRPRLEAAGIEVTSLDLAGRYAPLRAVTGLRRVVRRVRPDIIHSQLWRAGMVARTVSRLSGVPVVQTLVNEPLTSPARSQGAAWRRHLLHRLDRATASWVGGWIANSAAIADAFVDALGLHREDIRVIHRARDADRFHPSAETAAAGDPPPGPRLLNVGRLRSAKGQEQLLDLMPAVLAAFPTARLEIAGEGPYRADLERRRDRLELGDAVRLLGHRGDVPALLAGADLFLFPSHHEGHPGALVEAMLGGRAIIASDIPVHRETVEHGVSGLLLPSEDTEAWSAAIIDLLRHPDRARDLGAAARRRAVECFDLELAARRHLEVYRRLVGRPEPAP